MPRPATSAAERRRKDPDTDESLASFISRRCGQEVLDVLAGPLLGGIYSCDPETLSMQAALPHMLKAGRGVIVNMASMSHKRGGPGTSIHYAASKGAVVNLTRSMAADLGPTKITVNAIAPGATDSPTVLAQRAARGATPRRAQRILDREEVPEDLLGTLVYLSSPASEFVTGQTIVVDGGSYLH